MIHTMKPPNISFNLLFLEYSELLINSSACLVLNSEKSCMEHSTLHMNTRSFILVPDELDQQALKFSYSDNFDIKMFTFEDVYQYFQNIDKETSKKAYISNNPNLKAGKKSVVQEKKSIFPQLSISIPVCNFEFKLVNLSEWMNKFVLDSDFKNNFDKNISNQKNINQIFNARNLDIGKVKSDENELGIPDITNLLSQHSYRSSYFISLLSAINDSFPLSSNYFHSFGNLVPNENTTSHSNSNYKSGKEKEKENPNSMKYFFMLIKANKVTKITRLPSIKYDMNLDPGLQLLILAMPASKLNQFLEDRKLAELIYSQSSDDQETINKIIRKKNSDVLEYLGLNRELLDIQATVLNAQHYKLVSKVTRILPEGNQNGILIIKKNNQIQFYPSTNNYKQKIVGKQFMVSEVSWMLIYRYLYKNKALNVSLYKSQRGILMDFETVSDMEITKGLMEKECFNINKNFNDLNYHTNLWVNGHLTNYDYLMYLNFMSSRSFNEPSQYPIFPWIILNYDDIDEFDLSEIQNYRNLTKPVGALNPDKLERLKKLALESEMGHLYQNHYSTPFKLSYYLIRAFPHFSLRLNSGKHDKSDRIFYSLKDCWEYLVDTATNHVYELTPEFFNSDGEFLLNINDVSFDRTQEGKNIDNVILPKWAKNPKDFININRSALESEYVSCTLNDWIDLIFGYKQRGKEAENADNVFQSATYDDFEYDKFDEYKKQNYLLSIIELGQTPKKLFNEPHQKKKSVPSNKLMSSAPEYLISKIAIIKEEKERQEKALIELEKEKETEKQKLEQQCRSLIEDKKQSIKTLKE